MLTVLKPFLMAGVYYGPRQDRTSFKEAVRTAQAARDTLLAQSFPAGKEAERESLLADANDRVARAERALELASIPRKPQIDPVIWQQQRPRLRQQLLRSKFVLQTADGAKTTRRGSRARRAEVRAQAQ